MRPLALLLVLLAPLATAQEPARDKPSPEAPARAEATTTVDLCGGTAGAEPCASGEAEASWLERVAFAMEARPYRTVPPRNVLRWVTLDLRRGDPVEVSFTPLLGPPAWRGWQDRRRDDGDR